MANDEHLNILNKGVEAWNSWRSETSAIRVDLCGVDLTLRLLTNVNFSNVDLTAANLNGAFLDRSNLERANLVGANLQRAVLREAHLFGATLEYANLPDTDLSWSNLAATNLSKADLRDAVLVGANLCNATLREANLANCQVGWTQFDCVDLSSAKALESVHHREPSIIGIDTIYLSKGCIPVVFLQGAGVPEPFITNMKALVASMDSTQFYSCFISYSSKDHEFAERLHTDLQNQGVRCWFAPQDLKIGDKLRTSFDEAIRVHDKLMVILSESSVKSEWVEKEIETAFEKERKQSRTVLFPVRVDDAVMETAQAWVADIRRTRHIGDFCDWKNNDSYRKAFDRLLRDLKAETKAESSSKK